MSRLSDNYYLRNDYLKRNLVPTQSFMKEKMRSLAEVYFKSMTPKIKVLAGIEPPLKGGGTEWFMPPQELLAGRAVLKPIKKEHIIELGAVCIERLGHELKEEHYQQYRKEIDQATKENNDFWKDDIFRSNRIEFGLQADAESKNVTRNLQLSLADFEKLYRISIIKLEESILTAAKKEIESVREDAYENMKERLAELLKCQAANMQDEYQKKLDKEKSRLKTEFINQVEIIRTNMSTQVHEANYEKHTAIEKLRHYLECQNLASQVYVVLKEREECERKIEQSKNQHMKTLQNLKEESVLKDFEINKEIEMQKKRSQLMRIWEKKVFRVAKRFQMFVEYCLRQLPQHAEFFTNVEKLMLLQLSQAVDTPNCESSLDKSDTECGMPQPRPHPFYLVSDKKQIPKINSKLCPKHVTSSASMFPVIIINGKCVYSACDNFEKFENKVAEYVYGNKGDDADFEDLYNYEINVPIKYSSSTKLQELKLESSIMQIIQTELPNYRDLPVVCRYCKSLPYCFCCAYPSSEPSVTQIKHSEQVSIDNIGNYYRDVNVTHDAELRLLREPKLESYLKYVAPKRCSCPKTAKNHLYENLPPYMRNMSKYDSLELPNYEICPVETLKRLVRRANKIHVPPLEKTASIKEAILKKDAATQYSDQAFDYLCNCFSYEEISSFLGGLIKPKELVTIERPRSLVVDGSVSHVSFSKTISSFATSRAYSLRKLIDSEPTLEDIMFKKRYCK